MRVLFLGETIRADAQTWIKGLVTFGDAQIETFELKQAGSGIKKIYRIAEWAISITKIKKIISSFKPDIIVAERVTSYGFLAALSGHKKVIVAQQGITDVYPENSPIAPIKRFMARYTFKRAILIHAWGKVMVPAMIQLGADPAKILILPKGIDIDTFQYNPEEKENTSINAIVTRSLFNEYRHEVILKAFRQIKDKNIPFNLVIVGDGPLRGFLESLAERHGIRQAVKFTGRIDSLEIASLLRKANLYISMPITEGVSASLLEAMSCGCFPIVTDLPANRDWISNGVNGYLIPVDDSKSLADAIEKYYLSLNGIQSVLISNRKTIEMNAALKTNMNKIIKEYKGIIHQE